MIQVKCFEEEHEADLEEALNDFLSELNESDLLQLQYCVSHFYDTEQIYSFSACVVYRINS
jgi:hypothetical protein